MEAIGRLVSKIFPPNEKNVSKNKGLILDLLFNSEYQELSTQESIELFGNVKREFEAEIKRRGLEA